LWDYVLIAPKEFKVFDQHSVIERETTMAAEKNKENAALVVGSDFAETATPTEDFNVASGARFAQTPGGLPTGSEIVLDVEVYLPELDDLDISETQKRALIETLWPIARSFVELGFNPDTCGQLWGRIAPANKGNPGNGKVTEGTAHASRRLPRPDEGTTP
jgi:hypothetical protein